MQISKDIGAIFRYLHRQRHQYLEPLGLKSIHGRYLLAICKNPGISQDGLSQVLGFDKSNVARQAAFLEENGFLRRCPGQDKRMLCLHPTDKTLQLLPGLEEAMEQWEQQLLRGLTRQEIQVLSGLLEKLRRAAEQEG